MSASQAEYLALPSAKELLPSENASDYLAEPSGRAERLEYNELAGGDEALGIGGEILLGGTSKRLERKARPKGTPTQ